MQYWYLIYTKLRQEKTAHEELEKQGYTTYLPQIDIEKIVRGTRTAVREPLFARYLFIRLDPEGTKSWAPIRSTKGVARLVHFGVSPARVADSLVEAIRESLQEVPIIPRYLPGEVVTITAGAFRGLEAVFQAYEGDHRAALLLTLIGKKVSASQELSNLIKS